MNLTPRDFLTEEVYLTWLRDLESMRELRNKISSRRPTEEEILQLRINKPWERFYAAVLNA